MPPSGCGMKTLWMEKQMKFRGLSNFTKKIVTGFPVSRAKTGICSCGLSDKGLKRDNNEDTFLIVENDRNGCDTKTLGSMYAVADGMGGHCAGETASRTACESLMAYYSNSRSSAEDLSYRLSRMFAKADRDIFELSQEDPGMADMGTTLSVLVIREDSAYICHVGDSRIYRLREGRTPEEACRTLITAALDNGGEDNITVIAVFI